MSTALAAAASGAPSATVTTATTAAASTASTSTSTTATMPKAATQLLNTGPESAMAMAIELEACQNVSAAHLPFVECAVGAGSLDEQQLRDNNSETTTDTGTPRSNDECKTVVHTYPRPPGGYKYSIDFLYNIGRDLAGITLNIPTPTSITPRQLRNTPPPPPPPTLLPLLTNALSIAGGAVSPTAQSGTSSPNGRFNTNTNTNAGNGNGSGNGAATASSIAPAQFIYPSYMPSGPQRRLWHAENTVWQFDRNYPYNQGYSSQFGIPLVPLGFEHPYSGQRFMYPGYFNQNAPAPIPGMPSPTTSPATSVASLGAAAHPEQQQQQQELPPDNFQNSGGNGHHHNQNNYGMAGTWRYGRPNNQRERFGTATRPAPNQGGPGVNYHRESKTYYNSSTSSAVIGGAARYKPSNQRYQQQQQQQQQHTSNNGQQGEQSNGNRRSTTNYQRPTSSLKRQKNKDRNSNSSGSLSTSSARSQMECNARAANEEVMAPQSPVRHPQRSYRNRVRYADGNSGGNGGGVGGGGEMEPSMSAGASGHYPMPTGQMRRMPKYPGYQHEMPSDYGNQCQPHPNMRFYQSGQNENYGYHQPYMGGGAADGNESPGALAAAASSSAPTSECDQPLEQRSSGEYLNGRNAVHYGSTLELDMSQAENSGPSSRGGYYNDDASFGSLAASLSSNSSNSEMSAASVESLVRNMTAQCLANAANTNVPNLSGPNLVPYGDMHNLREIDRKSKHDPKNGYNCTSCCGDMLELPLHCSVPGYEPIDHIFRSVDSKTDDEQENDGDDGGDGSSEVSAVSYSISLGSGKGNSGASTRANIIMDEAQDELPLIMHNRYWHEFFGYTPADRFLQRSHLVELRRPPRGGPVRAKWDSLTLNIWHKFRAAQQTRNVYKTKMRLWRFIYTMTMATYPRYGLYLVGSSISYFGSKCSDMDICMLACTNPNIDPRMEAVYHLQLMRELLATNDAFKDFNLIEARVPILRFTDRSSNVEVDINFNNSVGIRNTHLLYCYSQLEWRVRPIAITVKQWAQYHNINNAKNMTISSYSLMLMVIHFLQAGVNPPVLPCLHKLYPERFSIMQPNECGYVDMNEIMEPYETDNNQNLGELLLGFLHYYSVFEYSKYAISVRVGGVLPIEVCRGSKASKNDIHQWNELCIEEPFDQTNTARSVYDPDTFDRIRAIFLASYRRLESSRNLNSIFEDYDGPTILMQPRSADSDDEPEQGIFGEAASDSELPSPKPAKIIMVDKAVVALWGDIGDQEEPKQTPETKLKFNDLIDDETKRVIANMNTATATTPEICTPPTTAATAVAAVESVATPLESVGIGQRS